MIQFGLPVVVIVLALASYNQARRQEKRRVEAMTPERKALYEAALLSLKDPQKLRELADVYESEHLEEEAVVLRKRAHLRELPADIQAQRRDAFRLGMSCKDPQKVRELADAFSSEACFSAATNLRLYESGLVADDVTTINRVIAELESTCQKIPETGQVRSKATRQAITNLKNRITTMEPETTPKDAGGAFHFGGMTPAHF
jgi:hypothetical protein